MRARSRGAWPGGSPRNRPSDSVWPRARAASAPAPTPTLCSSIRSGGGRSSTRTSRRAAGSRPLPGGHSPARSAGRAGGAGPWIWMASSRPRRATDGSFGASARLGLLDLLTTGTTTILDMGTTHGGDVIAEELVASGIRARFGQTMMDGGDGVPNGLRETTEASLDASARLAKRWGGAADGRISYAYAPRFALSCTRELLEAVGDITKRSRLLVPTHSNENGAERALIEGATGQAPTAYLDSVGLVNERSVIAHGVNLDEREIAILAERGASVTHCPSSNLKLGSGIADVRALRDRGITVGIGADGAACNNRLDGF